jgi:hypothetical protein
LSFCTCKARSTFVPVEIGERDADSDNADDGGGVADASSVADARGGVFMGLEVVELARLVQQHVGGGGGGSRSGGGQVQGHVAKQALRKLKEKTKETNAISAASETLAAERESDLQSFRSSNAQLRVDNHAASRLFFLLRKKKLSTRS